MSIISRPKGVNGHQLVKEQLESFWSQFGGRKGNGDGFPSSEKLEAVKRMADLVIEFHRQQSNGERRDQFNGTKATLHKFRKFGSCFVCSGRATSRHHLIQLQHGGINSKKNLVSLCDPCHAEVHPWLKGSTGSLNARMWSASTSPHQNAF